jgi:hypothetical protein
MTWYDLLRDAGALPRDSNAVTAYTLFVQCLYVVGHAGSECDCCLESFSHRNGSTQPGTSAIFTWFAGFASLSVCSRVWDFPSAEGFSESQRADSKNGDSHCEENHHVRPKDCDADSFEEDAPEDYHVVPEGIEEC